VKKKTGKKIGNGVGRKIAESVAGHLTRDVSELKELENYGRFVDANLTYARIIYNETRGKRLSECSVGYSIHAPSEDWKRIEKDITRIFYGWKNYSKRYGKGASQTLHLSFCKKDIGIVVDVYR